jgi:hypothetical protein
MSLGGKVLDFIKNYLLYPEILVLIVIISLCIYLYMKYDRHKIKITMSEIDYSPLFNNEPQTRKFTEEEYLKYLKEKKGKPHKKVYKHEERCREILEKIFNRKFPSVRPDFLKNPATGYNLELDGYCPELKIAFEYDGTQHSKYNEHFHRGDPKQYAYQVAKDEYKTKKCKLENITLIRIPSFIHYDKLEEYIKRELRRENKL